MNQDAADFLRTRLSQEEIDRRLDRIEADSSVYLQWVLRQWADGSRSPSVLMAVAGRLMAVVMVMGDASVTEYEMAGGVLDDDALMRMVSDTAKAYANDIRADMTKDQRVN